MNYPIKAESLKSNDAKLGGKYRMSNVREFIALSYLLYIASERSASVDYSDGMDRPNQLKLNPSLSAKINNILSISNVESLITHNPLLTGQFEYILVAMERVFCLGSVVFNNRSYNNSKERTGGSRYPKTLKFSTNMMILDLILSSINQETRNSFLKEWLQNRPFTDYEVEKKITSFLTICSQYSLFRVRTEDDEIVYRPIGIYEQIAKSGSVSIVDSREQAGTASIYNNVLKESLNPWLDSKSTDNITFNNCNDLDSYIDMLKTSLSIARVSESDFVATPKKNHLQFNLSGDTILPYNNYLTAIRTKPFILLAGISGTGKSRIVREFAFKSCPEYLQDKDGTTPGNYCMIEVKPNWHDSTELLGYYSRLGKAGYQFTKFVKFLVKAKMFPTVPFFVCLDEMNLAPVEQYFAEILSILESRKHPKNEETDEVDMNRVKTEPIIDAQYFRELSEMSHTKNTQTGESFSSNLTDRDIYFKLFEINTKEAIEKEQIAEEAGNRYELTTEGLTLPDNVVIIGTVNMDDTTHQFSRKVIDRAMTIEMNGGNLRNMFGGSKNLEYLPEEDQKKWQCAFSRRYVTADEVLEAHSDEAEELMDKLPSRLEEINKALKGTPFEVSYRVLNELTIMVGVMLDEGKELDDAIARSVNNILLMKILPRIEGDAEMFALSREYKTKVGITYDNRLEWLKELAPDIKETLTDTESGDDDTEEKADAVKEHQPTAKDKIQEMIDRLNNQEFTRFWP